MSEKSKSKKQKYKPSTLAALLEEKPKRGRPPHAVRRQNIYVALRPDEKALMKELVALLPAGLTRADLADLAISILTAQMENLRRAVAGRSLEIPEGITDLASLYLLWDLPLPPEEEGKWTTVRVSPQQAIELGRTHGTLNAAFGTSRSETFSLALTLLTRYLDEHDLADQEVSMRDLRNSIMSEQE